MDKKWLVINLVELNDFFASLKTLIQKSLKITEVK